MVQKKEWESGSHGTDFLWSKIDIPRHFLGQDWHFSHADIRILMAIIFVNMTIMLALLSQCELTWAVIRSVIIIMRVLIHSHCTHRFHLRWPGTLDPPSVAWYHLSSSLKYPMMATLFRDFSDQQCTWKTSKFLSRGYSSNGFSTLLSGSESFLD